MKKIFLIIILCLFISPAFANEKMVYSLGESFYDKGEYYHTITEMKRYQFFYPGGELFAKSQLLMGKAYMKGGNYRLATSTMADCYNHNANKPEGQLALILLGFFRLAHGSPYYALRTFQEYNFVYKDGLYREKSDLYQCYAATLLQNFDFARDKINSYKKSNPKGTYLQQVNKLELDILNELNRPRKSALLAGIGSALIPGFGYFYTGDFKKGVLALVTNAALMYLMYNSYQRGNTYQLLFFSIMELSFYQYSLFGGINSVYEHNRNEDFYKQVRLGLSQNF